MRSAVSPVVGTCLAALLVVAAGPLASAQYSRRAPLPPAPTQPPPPLPDPRFQSPQSYGRACVTPWGICPLAAWVAPGTPCHCYVPYSGTWVSGHAREWNWYSDAP